MGTWGSGNFDNDAACDYLNDVEQELVGRIEEILADEDRSALGEEGESVLMPTVVILSVLHEQCRLGVPEPATVARWKQKFLAVYDDQIDGFEPSPGHKEARRAVIEATFLKLQAQAMDMDAHLRWQPKSRKQLALDLEV